MRGTSIKNGVDIFNSETSAIFDTVEGDSLPHAGPEVVLEHLDGDHAVNATRNSLTLRLAEINVRSISIHSIHGERKLFLFNLGIVNKMVHKEGSNFDLLFRKDHLEALAEAQDTFNGVIDTYLMME